MQSHRLPQNCYFDFFRYDRANRCNRHNTHPSEMGLLAAERDREPRTNSAAGVTGITQYGNGSFPQHAWHENLMPIGPNRLESLAVANPVECPRHPRIASHRKIHLRKKATYSYDE